MASLVLPVSDLKERYTERKYLLVAGLVYAVWWLLIHLFLPKDFNPLGSRLAVVAMIFAFYGLSFRSACILKHFHIWFEVCLWVLTLHYFYLFYGNAGSENWVIGSYITVFGTCFCFFSRRALVWYSIFVVIVSGGLIYVLPELRSDVFFPGILTMLLQANISLRSRLSIIDELKASNERFQMLFNSTFEGVLLHENRKIIDVNETLASALGYTREEMIGQDPLFIIHPDLRTLSVDKMQEDETSPFETKVVTRRGDAIAVELRAKNFGIRNRLVRFVEVLDITDRKKAEDERVAALTLAENVRARDEFISIASHELKTPISSLKLQLQLLERDFHRSKSNTIAIEKMAGFLDLFHRQIKRLIELVETMLDATRISADALTLERKSCDFAELVRDIARSLGKPFELDLKGPLVLYADPNRLSQVVENLLTNAVKYGEGKPIRVRVFADGGDAVLTVQDQGMGIESQFIPKIFDRFERAVPAQNISGLGLGLYIVKKIVEAHAGSVSVSSVPREGTTFTVRIPRA